MSLVANKDAILNIDAPTIIIKVIDRNGRKKITTISGLFVEYKSGISPYFSKEVIMDYLLKMYIPKEKIKIAGI